MAIRTSYQHGQFSWVDLIARDMVEAREFYNSLFGWDCVDVDTQGGPPYAHFTLHGHVVAGLGQMDSAQVAKDTPASWNNYINVDDIEKVVARAAQLGAQLTVPVKAVRDAGRLAFLQDPTGAEFGLWQKGSHFGAALAQDIHCFCWNELCTRDLAAASDFYGALFDWEFADYEWSTNKYLIIMNRGEANSGMMELDDGWGDMPPRWMTYFAAESVDITVDYVRQLGGYVLLRPVDITEGRLAIVADSQGAMFQLVETTDDSAPFDENTVSEQAASELGASEQGEEA